MAEIETSQLILPSIMDRLIDENPGVSTDVPKMRVQAMRDLRNSVRRDLEAILNTRQTILNWSDDLTEINYSVIDFGVADMSGLSVGSEGAKEEFRALIEDRIRKFEPRFKSVEVKLVTNSDADDRALRFHIDAWLDVNPAPEHVDFDSVLDPISRTFAVKGGVE